MKTKPEREGRKKEERPSTILEGFIENGGKMPRKEVCVADAEAINQWKAVLYVMSVVNTTLCIKEK